ncbi:MAG: translation initiation factor IF-3 [bacterium]
MKPFVVDIDSTKFRVIDLVTENGGFRSRASVSEAYNQAKQADLDLVCFNQPNKDAKDELPLCKIIDYGKWKYSIEKQNKKKEKKKTVKELRFSPHIAPNDINHKVKQAISFLKNGNDVIFTMKMKGRQSQYFKEAEQKLNDIIEKCMDVGEVISNKKTKNAIFIRVGAKNNKSK